MYGIGIKWYRIETVGRRWMRGPEHCIGCGDLEEGEEEEEEEGEEEDEKKEKEEEEKKKKKKGKKE
jgi:hypothetical protein